MLISRKFACNYAQPLTEKDYVNASADCKQIITINTRINSPIIICRELTLSEMNFEKHYQHIAKHQVHIIMVQKCYQLHHVFIIYQVNDKFVILGTFVILIQQKGNYCPHIIINITLTEQRPV